MNIVNMLLRVSSILVLAAVIYQIYWSKPGNKFHRRIGAISMALGVIIMGATAIRAAHHHEGMSLVYGMHSLYGTLFFVSLFITGYLGWRARTNRRFARPHGRMGEVTLCLLAFTLVVGIISVRFG